MKRFHIPDKAIVGLYTFETTWIGREHFDMDTHILTLPLLNVNVDLPDVLNHFGITNHAEVYIEHTLLIFEGVERAQKQLAIHTQKRDAFLGRVDTVFQYTSEAINDEPFEFNGMGVYGNHTYDGVFKIHAKVCFLAISDNTAYTTEFKGMNEYNPIEDKWLKRKVVK
jgi:hypothetical protein